MNSKYLLLIVTFLASGAFFFTRQVMPQELSYHTFIDSRIFFHIPNTLDVISNLTFMVVGLLGYHQATQLSPPLKKAWAAFFLSILLVAPGSAYYHWNPNNQTLIWDRLPMSTGFMALYIVLLAEHISVKWTKLLAPALLTGLSSVVVWVMTDDLRFYFWVQFSSFLSIPIILLAFPSRFSHKSWYAFTLVFYILAKWTESNDREIFQWSQEIVSGHTLKHLLAAVGLLGMWWMLKVRKDLLVTTSSGSVADAPSL